MFEGREEATQKHVLLLQRQVTVCKQAEKKKSGKIKENRESENISLPAASHILSLSAFFLHRN